VGGLCWWRSAEDGTHRRHDKELRSASGLTRQSGGWINRIGRLTRGVTPDAAEIYLLGGDMDEGSGRLRGSEPNLMPCRQNRLCIMVGCIACASRPVYMEYKSLEG
jgi:hypothetical protein